LKSKESQLF